MFRTLYLICCDSMCCTLCLCMHTSVCVHVEFCINMMCAYLCVFVCAYIIGICSCSIQGGQQRSTGVCLVQCSGQRRSTQRGNIIFEINKFLIGLQWGKERQLQQGRAPRQRVDDDTNRSISSIEEDFLTASEHLGDDSEDDGFRNGESHYLHPP